MEMPAESSHEPKDEATIDHEPAGSTRTWGDLKRRIISALVLATIALFCVLAGGLWFIVLVLLGAIQIVREWDVLTDGEERLWRLSVFPYVAIPAASLIWLRNIELLDNPYAGMHLMLYLLLVVAAVDIGAYFAGKQIGGPKLAPTISPSKTWAGLLGGAAAAALVGAACASFTPYPLTFATCLWVAIMLAIVAQAGDLFESWMKRRAGVKDAGGIIPGHGGVLDRVDGLLFAAPVFALLVGLSPLV